MSPFDPEVTLEGIAVILIFLISFMVFSLFEEFFRRKKDENRNKDL